MELLLSLLQKMVTLFYMHLEEESELLLQDIDLVAQGDGSETGYVNVSANGGMVGDVNEFKMEAKGACIYFWRAWSVTSIVLED